MVRFKSVRVALHNSSAYTCTRTHTHSAWSFWPSQLVFANRPPSATSESRCVRLYVSTRLLRSGQFGCCLSTRCRSLTQHAGDLVRIHLGGPCLPSEDCPSLCSLGQSWEIQSSFYLWAESGSQIKLFWHTTQQLLRTTGLFVGGSIWCFSTAAALETSSHFYWLQKIPSVTSSRHTETPCVPAMLMTQAE